MGCKAVVLGSITVKSFSCDVMKVSLPFMVTLTIKPVMEKNLYLTKLKRKKIAITLSTAYGTNLENTAYKIVPFKRKLPEFQ